jgi:hypothetical protein
MPNDDESGKNNDHQKSGERKNAFHGCPFNSKDATNGILVVGGKALCQLPV